MKPRYAALLFLPMLFIACDKSTNPSVPLYVKFENSSASQFTITDIQLRDMGPAGQESSSPLSDWGESILTDGATLAPGEHQFFTLDIPSSHYYEYRLGVLDENSNHILLHEQEGYGADPMLGRITHWGSHDRSVSVTVVRDALSDLIVISGYSDWAGIE